MSEASMPHCRLCGRVEYDCVCRYDDGSPQPQEGDDDTGGVHVVADEAELPDRHPDYAEFLSLLNASLADPLTPGVSLGSAVSGGMFDELLAFAFLAGRPGERVTEAEMGYVFEFARNALADATLVIAAMSGTFYMTRRGDRVAVGVRPRYRAAIAAKLDAGPDPAGSPGAG